MYGIFEFLVGFVVYLLMFEYILDINFIGYDYFIYSVDDSLDNTFDTILYDVVSVVVVVGFVIGKFVGVVLYYWVDEDMIMMG